MSDGKKPREKPFTLYPTSFSEEIQHVIKAGPHKTNLWVCQGHHSPFMGEGLGVRAARSAQTPTSNV